MFDELIRKATEVLIPVASQLLPKLEVLQLPF